MNVNDNLIVLAAAVFVTGFAFFTMRWAQLRRGYGALSQVERRRAEVSASRGEVSRPGLRERARAEAQRLGLGDNPFPLYAGAAVTYLACAAGLTMVASQVVAVIAAFPAAIGAGWLAAGITARRRRSAFNRQLVDLLDLTVSQIKGGVGAERALHIVVPQLQDPIRSEMARTLATGAATKDLVEAMRDLARRYPSKAFDMFLAALEIDRAEGHAIAPALDQAAALLKQDFTLAAEANAKLGQVKYEFYAVAGIVAGIALYLIFGGGEEMKEQYFTTGGLICIAVAVGNGAIGFYRFFRKLNALTGDTK